ncbi:hypothetical protein CAL7716_058300 [Calothrix sp. PCC 7716]|nr:hypothetical protein CAL7716_058300 [Calothrix sp. PCC 7716]
MSVTEYITAAILGFVLISPNAAQLVNNKENLFKEAKFSNLVVNLIGTWVIDTLAVQYIIFKPDNQLQILLLLTNKQHLLYLDLNFLTGKECYL